MSWFFRVLARVKDTVCTGWTRLVQGVASLATPKRPCAIAVMAPVPASNKGDTFVKTTVEISQPTLSGTSPPFQQPCRSAEVKRGSHAARALFHNPFKAPSPMGVYEITSNAFSPTLSDAITSFGETSMNSPSDSTRTENVSAVFDSPSPASPNSVSTAPTTPTSIDMSVMLDKGGSPQSISNPWGGDEDDIPLATLREHPNRHGLSGPLSGHSNDPLAWISGLKPSPSSPTVEQPTSDTDAAEPIVNSNEGTECEVRHVANTNNPDRPTSASIWWDTNKLAPEMDDVSVYSAESYLPMTLTAPYRNSQQAEECSALPEITFTPPSMPTSPDLLSVPASKESVAPDNSSFESFFSACSAGKGEPAAADDTVFKPSHLLVPTAASVGSYDAYSNPSASQADDDTTLKKRRRNACRLDTTSIDLIMAELDQVFPRDGDENQNHSSRLPDSPSPEIDVSQDIADVDMGLYDHEENPRDSFFLPPLTHGPEFAFDLSDASTFPEASLESRFSDSSDDEDDFYNGDSSLTFSDRSRNSWSSRRTSLDPSSILSTILEEEEEGDNGIRFSSFGDGQAPEVCTPLEPSAMDDNLRLADPDGTLGGSYPSTMTKRRWFSMIDLDSQPRKGESSHGRKARRMSAPPTLHSTRQVEPSMLAALINSRRGESISVIRTLPLPAKLPFRPPRGVYSACNLNPSDSVDTVRAQFSQDTNEPLPWTLYQLQEPVSKEHSSPASSPRSSPRSSISSIYSEYSELSIADTVSPNTPDTIPEEFEDTGFGVEEKAEAICGGNPDMECSLALHTVASNPQGLSGILAILDRLELGEASESSMGQRSKNYASLTSTQGRWSATDIDEYYTDSDESFGGDVATAV